MRVVMIALTKHQLQPASPREELGTPAMLEAGAVAEAAP
jgi:hypothetical protein